MPRKPTYVQFHAAVAGYKPGDVVRLADVDDPRVEQAVAAGYASGVAAADVDASEVETEATADS